VVLLFIIYFVMRVRERSAAGRVARACASERASVRDRASKGVRARSYMCGERV